LITRSIEAYPVQRHPARLLTISATVLEPLIDGTLVRFRVDQPLQRNAANFAGDLRFNFRLLREAVDLALQWLLSTHRQSLDTSSRSSRSGHSTSLGMAAPVSDVGVLGERKCVFNVDTQVSDRVLDLRVTKQNLHSAQVSSRLVNHRGLGPAQRVRSILGAAKADGGDPLVDQAGVLPRAHVVRSINAAREHVFVYRATSSFEPGEEAGAHIAGEFKLHGSSRLLLNDHRSRTQITARDKVADLDLHEVTPAKLAVDSRSNKARSRNRPSRSRKKRIAQICF
jgi:hypothetical protein